MSIEIVNMHELAKEKKRKSIMNTSRFHAWHHYYPPGRKDEMHCHNADQTFIVIEGECTMTFPDGNKKLLTPGMVAMVTGGSFYQLENTGSGPMIMMGNRSGPEETLKTISYETGKEIIFSKSPKTT